MSLETDGGSTAVSEAVATEATPAVSAPVVTEQKGEYTATDPGYEIILEAEPETDELAKLIEENKKPKTETLGINIRKEDLRPITKWLPKKIKTEWAEKLRKVEIELYCKRETELAFL